MNGPKLNLNEPHMMSTVSEHRRAYRALCLLLLTSACSGGPEVAGPQLGGTGIAFDANGDGKPDTWRQLKTVGETEVVVQQELDVNFDGRVDIRRFYDDAGEAVREELDMDFDGKTDVVTVFEGGKPIRKETDLEFDGKPNVIRYYEDGLLARLETDTNHDGQMDHWEIYKGGVLEKTGVDKDGDGQPDANGWRLAD